MITACMNYQVVPGKNQVFVDAFRAVLQSMQDTEGHTETRLYHDVDRPDSYLIASEWSSREVFEAFLASEQFARVTDWGREQILAARPRHEIYEK